MVLIYHEALGTTKVSAKLKWSHKKSLSCIVESKLYKASRGILGSRQLVKNLTIEGIIASGTKVRKVMKLHNLQVEQRLAYKVTTKRKHSDSVAGNLVSMEFNPEQPNMVWVGDVTYLRTREGWCYLAILMDLYSRKIIGWHISKHMTTKLVLKAM